LLTSFDLQSLLAYFLNISTITLLNQSNFAKLILIIDFLSKDINQSTYSKISSFESKVFLCKLSALFTTLGKGQTFCFFTPYFTPNTVFSMRTIFSRLFYFSEYLKYFS